MLFDAAGTFESPFTTSELMASTRRLIELRAGDAEGLAARQAHR